MLLHAELEIDLNWCGVVWDVIGSRSQIPCVWGSVGVSNESWIIFVPKITHLDLNGSAITSNGLIQLAQSQLFSQLEYLNVGYCDAERWHEDGQQLPPYLLALLTNSRRSNLKELDLRGFISTSIDLKEMPEIAKHFDHPNCEINF